MEKQAFIKKRIKTKEKQAFIKSFLSDDVELIKKLYSSQGYNFANIETKIRKIDDDNLDLVIDIDRGEQTKISTISFIGDKMFSSYRLRQIIASQEDKFWKIISQNTNFSENLIDLDRRLLLNYYKSNGYYDVKINSNTAKINQKGNVDLVYSINAGTRYIINS